MLNRLFKMDAFHTTIGAECMAGITTFMSMAYVIFVVPGMLAETGMPKDAVFAATVLASALTSFLMGFWANMPIALAPGMGTSAFFAYTVVLGMGLPWQTALAAVFISGIAFLILSVTRLRELIINAIPIHLKLAVTVGIGLFIAFIGLRSAGLVVGNASTLVSIGDFAKPATLLSVFGLLLTGALMALQVRGAILIGILVTTLAGMLAGVGPVPHTISEIVTLHMPSIAPLFMQLDLAAALEYGLLSVLFTMTVVDLFDSVGTIIGLARRAGLMTPDGSVRGLNRALITDSCGTILSGLLGTPSVTSYVESAAGIAEGGRTGLTAVVAGLLFLACLLFAPLIAAIQSYATAPALILVGALMMQDVAHIDFKDMTNALPAFLTIVGMPLTYSIAIGLGLGFISHALLKTCAGRAREVNPIMWLVAACFAVNFALR